MEAKKSEKADLEKKKGLHLEIGLVTILALVLVAFNLRSTDKKDSGFVQQMVSTEMEEEILQTQQEEHLRNGLGSVAAGLSVFEPGSDLHMQDVFERADDAMYQKKADMKASQQEEV